MKSLDSADKLINSALCPQGKERASSLFGDLIVKKAKEYDSSFTVDKNIRPVLDALALYFTTDESFENTGSLKKGIFLSGNVGAGKTLLMRAIFGCLKDRTTLISTNRIVSDYLKNGIASIDTLTEKKSAICFDDLGAELKSSKHMGTEMNVMEYIISERYQNGIPYYMTFFTSNLDASGVELMYGTRVRSRLREMCNFLVLGGGDRRR